MTNKQTRTARKERQPKKPQQLNRNGIRVASPRPERQRNFPGERGRERAK